MSLKKKKSVVWFYWVLAESRSDSIMLYNFYHSDGRGTKIGKAEVTSLSWTR